MEHNKTFHMNLMLITIVNQLEKVYFSGRIFPACLMQTTNELTNLSAALIFCKRTVADPIFHF